MNRSVIIQPELSYQFESYFDLPFEPEDILAEFDFKLHHDTLELRKNFVPQERMSELQARITRSLRYVSLSTQGARREVLVAPILLEVVDLTQAQLRIEYPLKASNQLQGIVDYYLFKEDKKLLISEARHADLTKGFTQLAVEMIALNQWNQTENCNLIGAVTTGDIWQFGVLHAPGKVIWQDINLFRVPADLDELMRILVASLLP